MNKYYCLCCGYKTLNDEPPGSFEICSVCWWEDDLADGGANRVSLKKAKENFKKYGVSDLRWKKEVKPPRSTLGRHPHWEKLYWPNR
jgi:hypothetical protein